MRKLTSHKSNFNPFFVKSVPKLGLKMKKSKMWVWMFPTPTLRTQTGFSTLLSLLTTKWMILPNTKGVLNTIWTLANDRWWLLVLNFCFECSFCRWVRRAPSFVSPSHSSMKLSVYLLHTLCQDHLMSYECWRFRRSLGAIDLLKSACHEIFFSLT